MKRLIFFLFAAVLACACQKNSVNKVCGSYSFKNGGDLEVVGTLRSGVSLLPASDTVFHSSLVPESGQMRILSDGGDELTVTMNITGGSPIVFDGKLSDGKIVLSPVNRKVLMMDALCVVDMPADVMLSVRGEGTVYGNTLVFSMEYTGNFKLGSVPCRILSSNVNCIATRNE